MSKGSKTARLLFGADAGGAPQPETSTAGPFSGAPEGDEAGGDSPVPPEGENGLPGQIPEIVTAGQLGAILGIDARSIGEAARRGDLERTAPGRYHLAKSIQKFVASKGGRGKDMQAEKVRLTKFQADVAEIKAAEAKRELVPASEIETAWATIVRDARAALLAVAPRIGQRLAHLTAVDIAAIDAEIRDALTRLGSGSDD